MFLGAKLMIYKREFIIMDCDAWTKRYLEDTDRPFGDPLPLPHTLYDPIVPKRFLFSVLHFIKIWWNLLNDTVTSNKNDK